MDSRLNTFVSAEMVNNINLNNAQALMAKLEKLGCMISGIYGVPTGTAPIQGSGPEGYLTVTELQELGLQPTDAIYLTFGKTGVTGGTEDCGPILANLNNTSEQPSTRISFFLSNWYLDERVPPAQRVNGDAKAYEVLSGNPQAQAFLQQLYGLP